MKADTGLGPVRQVAVYLLLACGVLINVAWFSDRAVYIDEHLFLSVARMTRDWGVLASGEWLFFGTYAPLAAHTHSPLGEYCLALLFAIVGRFDETAFRLMFGTLFSTLAAWGFYSLARRISGQPLLLTLLLLVSPAFFVFSPTLMMDIPVLAFLLVGVHWYLKGAQGSAVWLFAAALCFVISVAFGYAALVPLAVLLAVVTWKRRPLREFAVAVAPFAALVLWALALTVHYGELPLIKTMQHFVSVGSVVQNVLATPSFLGGSSVLPWLAVFFAGRDRGHGQTGVTVPSIALASILSVFIGGISIIHGGLYILLASAGVALILLFLRQARELDQEGMLGSFTAAAFPAVLLFFIVVGEFISARYMLLCIPWLYLALFRHATPKQLALLIAGTLPLSFAIATADYRFVNSYRDWVRNNVSFLQTEGIPVWNSTESGLRFYLEQVGLRTLSDTDPRPSGGDLVVRQAMFRYKLPERMETMFVSLKKWELTDSFPIRTFNQPAGAGFHGSGLGMVPFTFSREPYDRLEIVQMTPLALAQPAAVWSAEGPLLVQKDPEVTVPMALPPHTRIEYELEGRGSVETHDGHLTLRKEQADSIRWRNFRAVPESLAESR